MRQIRAITAAEERFRFEYAGHDPGSNTHYSTIRRDPVEAEPIGTIILVPYQVVGYDQDCDGSLMARLKQIDAWMLDDIEAREIDRDDYSLRNQGLYPGTDLVVTVEELRAAITQAKGEG